MFRGRGVPLVLCIVAIAFSPVLAQTGFEELRELSIEELLNVQVISSTQTYVRLPEAPSSVFVVTGDQIRRWGIRRLAELVERLVPGATASEDVDDMIISFRGVTADNNLKVLLLLNGHEYNTQWNDGPSSEVELGLMEDIKKVEVLIGPHSALYGSGALIGVINIITRSGHDFRGLRVSGNVGTGEYVRGEMIAGDEVNEDFNYFISAGALAADGYENNNNGGLNISRFPASWRLYGNGNYKNFAFQSRFTRSARALYVFASGPHFTEPWTNRDTFFIEGRRSFHVSDKLLWDLNLSFDKIQTQRHDFRTDFKTRAVGEERYTAKWTSFYSGWEKHHVIAGATYRRDEFGPDWDGDNYNFDPQIVNGKPIGLPADLYVRRNFTPYGRNVYSLFGQDRITLNPRITFLVGFRFDRVEAPQIRKPNLFSPRIAFVYTPTKKSVFKSMFTSGTSRIINAAVTSPDPINLGNPTVLEIDEPEKMHSAEISGSYQPGTNTDLSINVFYNSLQDIFGVDPSRTGMPFYLISGGRVDFVGFEGAITANLTDRIFLRVVHQHVQLGAVVDDPFDLLHTPDQKHLNNYPENMTKLLSECRISKNIAVNFNSNLIWNNYGFTRAPRKTIETGFYALVNANLIWNPNPSTQFIFSGYNLLNSGTQISPFHFARPDRLTNIVLPSRVYIAERNFNFTLSHYF